MINDVYSFYWVDPLDNIVRHASQNTRYEKVRDCFLIYAKDTREALDKAKQYSLGDFLDSRVFREAH